MQGDFYQNPPRSAISRPGFWLGPVLVLGILQNDGIPGRESTSCSKNVMEIRRLEDIPLPARADDTRQTQAAFAVCCRQLC